MGLDQTYFPGLDLVPPRTKDNCFTAETRRLLRIGGRFKWRKLHNMELNRRQFSPRSVGDTGRTHGE
jgi:hypothetical protein